jgi:hypothetical protein
MHRVQIKDHSSLQRDLSSKAVINTNQTAYKSRLNQIAEMKRQKEELDTLKVDVADIKNMLQQLLSAKSPSQ